jgi:serine kinase of HPr protein (carbohydrate metabolism regulator)
VLVSDEDVVIFEQMRHQLVVWLRIEAVRSGADISGQGPIQLLELLHQQDTIDDSRLQVISTLLSLSDQVISNRRATLLEYKQAMMFYLMHTRRS